jgi:hypothetical protein
MRLIQRIVLPLIALNLFTLEANTESPRPVIRVFLDVSARDSNDKSMATSYLSRELRQIGDVQVTTENPAYVIECQVIRNHAGGELVGYTLSYLVTSYMERIVTLNFLRDKISPSDLQFLVKLHSGKKGNLVTDGIHVCPPSELRKACADLIAALDGDVFQPARLSAQKYMNKGNDR